MDLFGEYVSHLEFYFFFWGGGGLRGKIINLFPPQRRKIDVLNNKIQKRRRFAEKPH